MRKRCEITLINKCSICTNIDRNEINEAIVVGESRSTIAEWWGISEKAVEHHANDHLPTILEKEGLAQHSDPILEGLSRRELQHRLYLINEIRRCEDELYALCNQEGAKVETAC